ncbi:MAG: ATP-binding cassette domain-containing protein [Christensenellaceae bacterium]|jgi:ABC-2 type transport system ATP-binding protein|nr:ATP-binding cassette domain-containing protein [Christensenellaceae bacterium]
METNTAIKISNLFKSYGANDVLRGLNLTLERGQCIGIVGKNGSGKTTLLKIISGLIKHYQGLVNKFENVVSALIDNPVLIHDFTGIENIEYMLDKQFRARAIEIANNFNLSDYLEKPVRQYSQGMRQKLAIAIVFATNPDIILLDEPFNSLDIDSSKYVIDLINEFKSNNRGIIVVTHNMSKIEAYCNHLYSLTDGIIKQSNNSFDNIQQYKITFLSEEDATKAQLALGEYKLESINNTSLLITFNKGNLPIIIKRLAHCNVAEISEIKIETKVILDVK